MHTDMRTYTHSDMHMHTDMHAYTQRLAYTHMCIDMHAYTHRHAHTHAHRHACIHTHAQTGATYTKVRLNRNQETKTKENAEMDLERNKAIGRKGNLGWRLIRGLPGKHYRDDDSHKKAMGLGGNSLAS